MTANAHLHCWSKELDRTLQRYLNVLDKQLVVQRLSATFVRPPGQTKLGLEVCHIARFLTILASGPTGWQLLA
jgi:hypothetical protein